MFLRSGKYYFSGLYGCNQFHFCNFKVIGQNFFIISIFVFQNSLKLWYYKFINKRYKQIHLFRSSTRVNPYFYYLLVAE